MERGDHRRERIGVGGCIDPRRRRKMSDDTFSASGGADDYGVYSINSTPTIRSSSITGTTYSVLNSSSTAKVANSVLNGPLGGAATFSNPQGNLRSDFTPITVYP